MPFRIKVAGQTHEAQEWTPPEEPEETSVRMSAAGFLAFENYVVMADSRARAISLWDRRERLGEVMDEHGVDHPKYMSAMNLYNSFQDQIIAEQVRFLGAEQRADRSWKALSAVEREQEGLVEYFGMKASSRCLYGLWRQPFAYVPAPDREFRMHEWALLIATPEQKTVYLALRFGRKADE
jgi:hypothetical protein